MGHDRYAVLVGVNAAPLNGNLQPLCYAEGDAIAMHAVLTSDDTGTFPPANVDLLVGPDATARNVKRRLRHRARHSKSGDLIVVYYSGHGFIPAWSRIDELFLATQDTDLNGLDGDPDEGLRASFMRQDIIEDTKADTLLVLDCCFSSAFSDVDSFQMSLPAREGSHAALLGYADSVTARESHELQHGEFTNDLLVGLAGSAAGDDGEVTVDGLHLWLARNGRRNVLRDARNWRSHVVLTRACATRTPVGDHAPSEKTVELLPDVRPAEGPLHRHRGGIQTVIDGLLSPEIDLVDGSAAAQRYRLDALRTAFGATSAAVVDFDGRTIRVDVCTDSTAIDAMRDEVQTAARRAVTERNFHRAYHYFSWDGHSVFVIPVSFGRPSTAKLLLAIDSENAIEALGDVAAVLAMTYWNHVPDMDDTRQGLELRLLSALKVNFGRLPIDLYDRAFELYREILAGCTVAFQPIVRLGNDGSCRGIRSVEALARRRASDSSAPGALLALPEVWGDKFTIERDIKLANIAMHKYRNVLTDLSGHDYLQPVAINVAVQSLLSEAYVDNLRECIRRNHLEGSVTLEISEQDQITFPRPRPPGQSVMEAFRDHLVEIARSLEVQFAIDDFGVRHSSLDRLAGLSLAQIKIDRSILRHARRLDELELVVKIAADSLGAGGAGPRAVVLEGLDSTILGSGDPPLTLRSVYEKGIRYIQGYIVGELAGIGDAPSREITKRIQPYW